MEDKTIFKEEVKMLEMIVFGVILTVSNLVTALILIKVLMSERVLKKYMKTVSSMTTDLAKEVYQQLEEDL
mgnify:CR=1 FL=1